MFYFRLAVFASALFWLGPAYATSDVDMLKEFGMYGRVAVDCSAPYSSNNPHLIYAVSSKGKITRTLEMNPELNGSFHIRNMRMMGPDVLQHDETGRQSELTITVAKIDGKFRSWRSVRADGTILIADGKFPASGNPTVSFEKCKD